MTNVIFFGHGATADDIRSRLSDLRAVGLLQDFLWIDYAPVSYTHLTLPTKA